MTHLLKFFHLLFGVGVFGAMIFNCCYIKVGSNVGKDSLKRMIKESLRLDAILLLIFLLMGLTGTLLVPLKNWTFKTPWIEAAYSLLGFSIFSFLILIFLKIKNFCFLDKITDRDFNYRKIYYFLYFLIFIALILLIHDAITKSAFWSW